MLAGLILLALPLSALEKAQGAEFVVNTTSDEDDAAPGDEACATASGQCTLRAAIQQANHASNDIISFAIPATDPGFDLGTGRHTINLTKALPPLTTDMAIAGPGADKLTVRRNTGGSYSVFKVAGAGASAVTLSGMTITRGYSQDGGGISIVGGTLNITACAVSGNAASGLGGGIFYNGAGDLNLTNSTVSGNFAERAGGIWCGRGNYNIINSTITGNTASLASGGIAFFTGTTYQVPLQLRITNSTISGNSAPSFGGIQNGGEIPRNGEITLKSTIIALNTANQNPDLSGRYLSAGFNLIGDGTGVDFNAQATDQIGSSAAPLDAKLDPNGLQNNGGPTQTIALLFGSPAIDKGTSSGLTGNLATDQRSTGFARAFENPGVPNATDGDGTDIGAFEVQSTATTPGLSTLANISTRTLVQSGDNVLIGGFIVVGANPRRVIVRAIGPSLNIAGKLADPTLELRDANGGLVRSNDNWRTGGQEAEIIATTIPPTNDLESAIVAILPQTMRATPRSCAAWITLPASPSWKFMRLTEANDVTMMRMKTKPSTTTKR